MRGLNLKQMWENQGPAECSYKLKEALEKKLLRPEDFSLREMAQAFMGDTWYRNLRPTNRGGYIAPVSEAGEGVDVTAFSDITGQLVFTKIMQGWEDATRVSEQIFDKIPTEFDGEKLPWISNIQEEAEDIHAGMPYPEASVGERYITTPYTQKKGQILSLTKEAVFFDRTGQLLRQAARVGEMVGYNKEKKCLRLFLGITNNYNLNGTAYNTYLTSGSNWINSQGSTPLVDYTSINTAYILSTQILDPDNNLPIQIDLKNLFVMPAGLFQAKRILGATETRNIWPAFATADSTAPGNVEMIAPNPIMSLTLLTSQLAQPLLTNEGGFNATQANAFWYIGDFKKAFAYMENWPCMVATAPLNNIKDFEQDIVMRWKASEQGAPVVTDARFVIKMYNT